VALGAQGQAAPKYKFDPDWPKTLPNKWKVGGITGLAVDKDDNVWVLNRPDDLRDMELEAENDPPTATCCTRPPSMIHIDKNGNVIGSFDAPQGHGLAVDSKGFVYIGQNTVRKYDPKTGKIVAAIPHTPEMENGQKFEEPKLPVHIPGKGSDGPGGNTPLSGGGEPSPAVAAFRAKYPPSTPMIVGGIEEIRLDEPAHEIYVADNYLGGRVMVFDLDTFAFKRGWGAYGHTLAEITTDYRDREYTPGGPMPKEFRGHLTLNISKDGKVYAADRMANRIHEFTKEGKYLKEFIMAPMTGARSAGTQGGSTGGVAFSVDPRQSFLFISDISNNHVWFLDRESGKVVGQLGSLGENGGQFFGLHMIAVDSKGNIYTGEVLNGERVQRFVPVK
jgi:DNA-binding beta-propeller fold protein YncE